MITVGPPNNPDDLPLVSQRGSLIPSPISVSFAVQSNILGHRHFGERVTILPTIPRNSCSRNITYRMKICYSSISKRKIKREEKKGGREEGRREGGKK